MEYLTIKRACEKWGLGSRIVTMYCSEGRINGATKGNLWLIPKMPRNPEDRRRKKVELKEAENQTFHSAKSVIQDSFVSPSELRSINEAMLSRIIEFPTQFMFTLPLE